MDTRESVSADVECSTCGKTPKEFSHAYTLESTRAWSRKHLKRYPGHYTRITAHIDIKRL